MEIEYRRLTREDVPTLVAMRLDQLLEEGAQPDFDLTPALMDFYARHMEDGTFVSWLALDEGRVVATSGMTFCERPPYYSNPTGRIGILSNMYTLREYRRRGIAKRLLGLVVDEARAYGCGLVQLTASDAGVLLYTAFGFTHNGNYMQYKLQ